MKIYQITSLLAVFAALNILYAIYTMTQRQILNTLVFISTFLCLIYSAALLEQKLIEVYEEKLIEEMAEDIQ